MFWRRVHRRLPIRLEAGLLVLLIPLVVPASAEARDPAACAVKGSKTVLSSKHARVFRLSKSKREPDDPAGPPRVFSLVYGCLYGTTKVSLLGGAGHCLEPWAKVGHIRLAGSYVGYSITRCSPDFSVAYVAVTSLRTGGKLEWRAFLGFPPPSVPCQGTQCPIPDVGSTAVTAVEVNPSRSVAWIAQAKGVYYPVSSSRGETYTQYEVRKVDKGGENVLLDAGSDIDPSSLRLSPDGTTIYWTKGVTESSAPLQ